MKVSMQLGDSGGFLDTVPEVRELDATSSIGPEGFVKEQLAALKESGVNCLNVALVGRDRSERVKTLEQLRNLVATA